MGVAVSGIALLTLAVSGCTSTPGDGPETDASAAFLACLTAAGVDAKISDQGYVVVRTAEPNAGGEVSTSTDAGTAGEGVLMEMAGPDGAWIAVQSSAAFSDDPDTQDAYAACEAEHPDFAQPEWDPASDLDIQAMLAEQEEAALEFARCAREEGFSWVADPSPETAGGIALPSDVTEAEFRALLTACGDADTGFGWAISGEGPDFDWTAVLMEFSGGSGAIVTQGEG